MCQHTHPHPIPPSLQMRLVCCTSRSRQITLQWVNWFTYTSCQRDLFPSSARCLFPSSAALFLPLLFFIITVISMVGGLRIPHRESVKCSANSREETFHRETSFSRKSPPLLINYAHLDFILLSQNHPSLFYYLFILIKFKADFLLEWVTYRVWSMVNCRGRQTNTV